MAQNIGPVNIMVGAVTRDAQAAIQRLLTDYDAAEKTLRAKRSAPLDLFTLIRTEKLREQYDLLERLERESQQRRDQIQAEGERRRGQQAIQERAKWEQLRQQADAEQRARWERLNLERDRELENAFIGPRPFFVQPRGAEIADTEQRRLLAEQRQRESAEEAERYREWLRSYSWINRTRRPTAEELAIQADHDDWVQRRDALKARLAATRFDRALDEAVALSRTARPAPEYDPRFLFNVYAPSDMLGRARGFAAAGFLPPESLASVPVGSEGRPLGRYSLLSHLQQLDLTGLRLLRKEFEDLERANRRAGQAAGEYALAIRRIREQENLLVRREQESLRRGRGSDLRELRYGFMQGSFALEDALLAYQYGGIGAAARAASNNLSAILATAIPNPMIAAGTVVGLAALTAAVEPLSRAFSSVSRDTEILTKAMQELGKVFKELETQATERRNRIESELQFQNSMQYGEETVASNEQRMRQLGIKRKALESEMAVYETEARAGEAAMAEWATMARQRYWAGVPVSGSVLLGTAKYTTEHEDVLYWQGRRKAQALTGGMIWDAEKGMVWQDMDPNYKRLVQEREAVLEELSMRSRSHRQLLDREEAALRRADQAQADQFADTIADQLGRYLDQLQPNRMGRRALIERRYEEERMGLMGLAVDSTLRNRLLRALDIRKEMELAEYERRTRVQLDKPFNEALEVGTREAAIARQRLSFGLDRNKEQEILEGLYRKAEAILAELVNHRPKTPKMSGSK